MKKLTMKKLAISNAVVCGLIGAVLGYLLRGMFSWLLGGLLVGGLTGWAVDLAFDQSRWRAWPSRRRLLLLVFVEALLFIYLFLPAFGAYLTVYPARNRVRVSAEELGLQVEQLSLTTRDGIQIKGWYIPSRNGAAVIGLHGLGANRLNVIPQAKILAEEGYGVLALDMRAHGESGGDRYTSCISVPDVQAAVDYLLGRPEVQAGRIGVLGISSGAHTALCAAAKTPHIQALFLEGTGFGDTSDALHPMLPEVRPFFFMTPLNWMYFRSMQIFGNSAEEPPVRDLVADIIPRALFFVAAEKDPFEPALAKRFAELAGESAAYWIVPGAPHAGGLQTRWEEYSQRMLDFFARHLLTR